MTRNTNVPAVYVLLKRADGKIACLLRQNTGYRDGEHTVVSGHVENDESFSMAAVRETKEEVGVDIDQPTTAVYVMHRPATEGTSHPDRIDVFFEVTEWQGEVVNAEPDKCVQVDWFDPDDLPDTLYDYERIAIQDIKNGIHYRELGFETLT